MGLLPLGNVVLLEVGAAFAVVLLAVSRALWPVAATVGVLALTAAGLRWQGRWITQWAAIVGRYLVRPHRRQVDLVVAQDDRAELARSGSTILTGPEDARVALLRLLVGDLVVASTTDREQKPIGLAWHHGTWTAAVLVDPLPAMVTPLVAHTDVPLAALADCLQDRGVILDGIQVVWHCYPGSSTLPPDSPALAAYHEVLGPLPAVARRSTWVVVRLDPRRCPAAVRERGGGIAGAHRALLGAVSRVRSALDAAGLNSRVLDTDELLRAAISCAELTAAAGRDQQVGLRERWGGVSAGGVGHSSYAISGWRGSPGGLDALTSVRALSTTVALALSLGTGDGTVGLRGLVRLSARTPGELDAADTLLRARAAGSGVVLAPLDGQQAAAVSATLPIGGTA